MWKALGVFFLPQPLALGGYSNKGSKLTGEQKECSVFYGKVQVRGWAHRGQREVRSRKSDEDQSSLKPLTPPDSETTISQGVDLTVLGIKVTIVLCKREACSYRQRFCGDTEPGVSKRGALLREHRETCWKDGLSGEKHGRGLLCVCQGLQTQVSLPTLISSTPYRHSTFWQPLHRGFRWWVSSKKTTQEPDHLHASTGKDRFPNVRTRFFPSPPKSQRSHSLLPFKRRPTVELTRSLFP